MITFIPAVMLGTVVILQDWEYGFVIFGMMVIHSANTATTAILWSMYRMTCVSWHSQLRTGGFC